MTSANSAVSVRKMSCTTRNSSLDSALRTLLMFGSDRNGFSPSMYMPRTPPLSAEPMISVTVRPFSGSRSAEPQARARLADVAGDRAQLDQAAGVVGAGGVLGNSHAPVDDARLGLAPHPGNP